MPGEMQRDAKALAKFWGVSERTVQRWWAKHMRPESVDWMRDWARTASRVPDAVELTLRQLAGEIGTGRDEELAAFLSEVEIGDDPRSDLDDLLRMKGLLKAKIKRALDDGNANDLKVYNTELVRITESIRKTRLMQERLGIVEGETLSREAAEQLAHSLVWWCMRSVDTAKLDLCKRLCGLTFPEEVWQVLEPYLLSSLVYLPITRSIEREPSGVSLPVWFTEALRNALDEFVHEVPDERGVESDD